jgi:hypothetical protein
MKRNNKNGQWYSLRSGSLCHANSVQERNYGLDSLKKLCLVGLYVSITQCDNLVAKCVEHRSFPAPQVRLKSDVSSPEPSYVLGKIGGYFSGTNAPVDLGSPFPHQLKKIKSSSSPVVSLSVLIPGVGRDKPADNSTAEKGTQKSKKLVVWMWHFLVAALGGFIGGVISLTTIKLLQ